MKNGSSCAIGIFIITFTRLEVSVVDIFFKKLGQIQHVNKLMPVYQVYICVRARLNASGLSGTESL